MTISRAAIATVLFLALAAWPLVAQESGTRPSAPGIDPFDPAAGDFLDTDLGLLARRAFDAYRAGDFEAAARNYLTLLRRNISDGAAIYNLACCFGLMGEPELAARYVARAFRAGFDDVDQVCHDPDFELVRGKDVFDRVVDSIVSARDRREAESGMQILIPARVHLKCRVRLPPRFSPDSSYRLVVGLHGLGGNPDQFARLWQRLDADPPFIYACPQAPYPVAGKEPGYGWTDPAQTNPGLAARTRAESETYVVDAVRGLEERYRVSEVYLLGFSEGGLFAYSVGIRHCRLFAGLVCFSGWLDTDWLTADEIEAAKDLRVFIGHGTEDEVVDFESGARARDLLAGCGYDVTFHEYPGDHSIPEDAARAAAAWLLHPGPSE